jgi:hypothetical protein
MKTANRIALAQGLSRARIQTNTEWITPATDYRLIDRKWFLAELMPKLMDYLKALGLRTNPVKPGHQCYLRCFMGAAWAKAQHAISGDLDHNAAIGLYGFYEDYGISPGHVVMMGWDEHADCVFGDLNDGQEYVLNDKERMGGWICQV